MNEPPVTEYWDASHGLSKTWTGRTKWVGRKTGHTLYGPTLWERLCAKLKQLCFASKHEGSE